MTRWEMFLIVSAWAVVAAMATGLLMMASVIKL